jgi:prepilin-type N-terminal cleavage/methylation domain-containing protein
MFAVSRPSSHPAARGFTLLELVVVLLMLTIILALAVPTLRGFVANSKERDAIAQLVALAQFAKARSAADAKAYRLNLEGASYSLTVQEGEAFVPLGNDFGRTFELPAGMRVEAMPSAQPRAGGAATGGSMANAAYVTFYPEGRTDTALFRLTDATGKATMLGCPSPAESFRVVSPEEAARL